MRFAMNRGSPGSSGRASISFTRAAQRSASSSVAGVFAAGTDAAADGPEAPEGPGAPLSARELPHAEARRASAQAIGAADRGEVIEVGTEMLAEHSAFPWRRPR